MTTTLTTDATAAPTAGTHPETARPARSRAVFSTEDFRLLRDAVMHHLQRPEVQDGPDSIKYGQLYHRLGRLG